MYREKTNDTKPKNSQVAKTKKNRQLSSEKSELVDQPICEIPITRDIPVFPSTESYNLDFELKVLFPTDFLIHISYFLRSLKKDSGKQKIYADMHFVSWKRLIVLIVF